MGMLLGGTGASSTITTTGGTGAEVITASNTIRSLGGSTTGSLSMSKANWGTINTGKFAVSFWWRPETNSAGFERIMQHSWSTDPDFAYDSSWDLSFFQNKLYFRFWGNPSQGEVLDGGGANTLSGDISVSGWNPFSPLNTWVHFYMIVDTTQATAADRVTIYLDGVEQSLVSFSGGAAVYPGQNEVFDTRWDYVGIFGNTSGGANAVLNWGKMFDFAFFDSSLGDLPDIDRVYNSGTPPELSGISSIKALLNLGGGTTVADDGVITTNYTTAGTITASTTIPS